jgi:hypothetical protein
MNKTNLTDFQRIFLNEKDLTQTTNGIDHRNTQTSSSVFEVIHSLGVGDSINNVEANQQQNIKPNGIIPLESQPSVTTALACNPLLLTMPHYDQSIGNGSFNGNCNSSSNSTNLTDGGFNSSMYINRMFDDAEEHVNILEFFHNQYLENNRMIYMS